MKNLFALVVTMILVAGCQSSRESVDTVVLVSVDSLRADHLGSYGYSRDTTPVIDGIAKKGVRFSHAFSTTSWTLPSHASMMTGNFNGTHGATDSGKSISSSVKMLAEALHARGVATTGFYSGPYLDPAFGFGRGFDEYVSATSYSTKTDGGNQAPVHDASHADVTNPILERRLAEWVVATKGKRAERNFIFIHMWDVHYDYIAPKKYLDLFDGEYAGPLTGVDFQNNPLIRRGMPERDREHLLALYDAEIRYTDETIGRLLEILKTAGMLDSAAVIVTADHGEEFFEHGFAGHRWNLFNETLRVPLVIAKMKSEAGGLVSDALVGLIDLFPTVCQLLSVDCNYSGPGTSLVPFITNGRSGEGRALIAQLTTSMFGIDQDAIVRTDDKLIRWNNDGQLLYFERPVERGETAPVRGREGQAQPFPARMVSAISELDEMERISRLAGAARDGAGSTGDADVPEKTKEHLRSLGYIQ